ncbi:MAG: helix-turn-helix transcriptional regulator [Hyphomonas sp.]|nr:helix-turn-helix transcriptional regulator [Hyphomonas sp.]
MDIPLNTPLDIGLLIKSRRKARGLGQAELAEKVGVSRRWLNQVESGKPGASMGLVLRTLAVLDTQLLVSDNRQQRPDVDIPPILGPGIDLIIDDLSNGQDNE